MAQSLPLLGQPSESARSAQRRFSVAAKGFRPFFLLAAGYAVAIVPVWLFMLSGALPSSAYVDPVTWHAHEMIFGFAVAVIAGFLLTAVGNWTHRETAVGARLVSLGGVWLLGRVVMSCAQALPRGMAALLDLAFLPILIVVLARPLVATDNRRNYAMLAVLTALFGANLVVHLEGLKLLTPGVARRACTVSVDVVLLTISIIAGRVFPMFTRNATGVTSIRSILWLDIASVASMATLCVLDAWLPEPRLVAAVAGVAAALAVARAWHWGARHSLGQPLLWILHAGYAWFVIGLVLRAVVLFDRGIPSALATHALTVGAIGSLTLGMMTRVALGHTGRLLVASPATSWAFAAVNASALTRVIVPWLAPSWYFASLTVAGVFWMLGFLIFLCVYAPLLWTARVDGKPG